MTVKNKTVYTCQSCAAQFPKWIGKCPDCNQWNTIVEETFSEHIPTAKDAKGHAAFKHSLKEAAASEIESRPLRLSEIGEQDIPRIRTKFTELDRVLGGGIVHGSLVLIGGDPGIGKSTILMQGLANIRDPDIGSPILYVTGEESARQVKLRATRLGMHEKNFLIYAENSLESVLEAVKKEKPFLLIIDSIQTVYSTQVQSAPGSVSQIRECTARLMTIAKSLGVATFIVGHVTKDGAIAGPKVLEHMVDTVLYFEGSTHNAYRVLRAVKNRFGSTNEIGVFEMMVDGLREVTNPSEIFLQERPVNSSGTVVIAAIEGSRPILVEVQALVSSSNMAIPRRTTLGFDHNKVSLLIAVIEKKLDIPLYGHDIFVNVAGGIRMEEPAGDLGAALALISSFRNKHLDNKLLVCGEVGLAGEVRRVTQLDLRLAEAEKLGFETALVPKGSLIALHKVGYKSGRMNVTGVSTLAEAVEYTITN